MKTLRSKLTVVFAFFAVIALAFGIGFMPKQASAAVDTSTGFYIEDGASIRTEVGESGIKWTAHISESKYAELNTEANSVVAIGIAIQPQGNTDSKLDIHYEYGYDSFEIAFTEGDFEYSYAIYYDDLIADIEAIKGDLDTDAEKEYLLEAYQTILEARPFVKHADGTYTYGEYFDTARSLQGVAVGNLVAGTYAEGSAEDTLLKSYLPNGFNVDETEYVADSYYSNYDAWGNIAINSNIPMSNARVYYGANDVTSAYNADTGVLALTADNKVETKITTDGSANDFITIYDQSTGNVYKQQFIGVTLAIDEATDLAYFNIKKAPKITSQPDNKIYIAHGYEFAEGDVEFGGYYVLTKDIDASTYTHTFNNENTDPNFGSYSIDNLSKTDAVKGKGLTGIFDGNGYTISNITIGPNGLFGLINGGTVKDLAIVSMARAGSTGGTYATYLINNATIQDCYLHTTATRNTGYSVPLIATQFTGDCSISKIYIYDGHYNQTGAIEGWFGSNPSYLNDVLKDSYYVTLYKKSAIVSSSSQMTLVPKQGDSFNANIQTVYADAKYIDGVEQTTVNAEGKYVTKKFEQTWAEKIYNLDDYISIGTYTEPYAYTRIEGLKSYSSIANMTNDKAHNDFSAWNPDVWEIVDGIPKFVRKLTGEYRVELAGKVLSNDNSFDVIPGFTFDAKAYYKETASEQQSLDTPSIKVVSGDGVVSVNGNTVTTIAGGNAIVEVSFKGNTYTVNFFVQKTAQELDTHYQFSAVDGLFFDGANVISVADVLGVTDPVVSAYDADGNILTVTEDGAILGFETSAKDWLSTCIYLYTENAGYKVFVDLAELIIDEATDLAYFGLNSAVTNNVVPALGEGVFDGYYVLSKNIDMSSYTHQFAGTSGVSFSPANFTKVTGLITEGSDLYGKYFTGTFDGQGYTISNFGMDATAENAGGLLGYINGGTVKNLAITARAAASNGTTCSAYSGVIAGGIMGDAVLSDLYIYVKGSRNNSDSTGLITGGITSSVTLTRLVVVWESTKNMPIGAGVLVDDASTTALLNANMTDCYFIADIPAALAATADANTTTTKLDDETVATGMRYHKVSADAKYVNDIENTTKTAKTFHKAWSLTTTVSTDTHEINLNGKTVYNAPYEIEIFEGLKRYTTTGMMNTATALANNDFSNWPGVWTIISGAPYFTSGYTLSNYTATLNGGAYSETSNVVEIGLVNTVDILRSGALQVNKPSLEVVSGAEFVSINGNTFKGIAGGDAVIKVVFGPVSHLIPITVDPSVVHYDNEYQFSAVDGLIFNGENVVAVSDIVTDNTYSKITDKDGNELTLSEGKISGMTTSTMDWEENQIQFHYADYVLVVHVKVAELIIDDKSDFEHFKAWSNTHSYGKSCYGVGGSAENDLCDAIYTGSTCPVCGHSGDAGVAWAYYWATQFEKEDDIKWQGYYVLAKDIDAVGYTHNFSNGYSVATTAQAPSRYDYLGNTGWFNNGFAHGFGGVFDGQGHTISNLTTIAYYGLFGIINTGTIQNVGFVNCNTTTNAGGFLAYAAIRGASFKDVYVSTPAITPGAEYTPLVNGIGHAGNNWERVVIIDNTTDEYVNERYYGSITADAARHATYYPATFNGPFKGVYVVSNKPMQARGNGTEYVAGLDARYLDGVQNTLTASATTTNGHVADNISKGFCAEGADLTVDGIYRYTTYEKFKADASNRDFSGFSSSMWTIVDGVPVWAKA